MEHFGTCYVTVELSRGPKRPSKPFLHFPGDPRWASGHPWQTTKVSIQTSKTPKHEVKGGLSMACKIGRGKRRFRDAAPSPKYVPNIVNNDVCSLYSVFKNSTKNDPFLLPKRIQNHGQNAKYLIQKHQRCLPDNTADVNVNFKGLQSTWGIPGGSPPCLDRSGDSP